MDSFITSSQLARKLGFKPQTMRAMRHRGGGPPYTRLGDGVHARVVYREADVERWLAERTYRHTAAEHAEAAG